jgi:hypothetical protein
MAKESPQPGVLLLAEGVPITAEDLADAAAISIEDVIAGLQSFENQRMIELDGDTYHLLNWDKRQFESDNSTERSRKSRAKKTEKPNSETTLQQPCNVAGTLPQLPQRQTTETETDLKDRSLTTTACAVESVDKTVNVVDKPTNSELIAELTQNYREIEGITKAKGDYAFIGGLYNEYGYERLLSALNLLQMAAAVQELKKPLVYLHGILKNGKQEKNKEPPRKSYVEHRTGEQEEKRKKAIESLYMS